MNNLNTGVWPTMLTPYTSDNQIDWKSLDELIEWYIASGVSGLFAVCLSSEIFHLTEIERIKLASHIVKRVNQRVQIVSGVLLSDNPENAIKQVYDTGVAAVVCLASQLYPKNSDNNEYLEIIKKIFSISNDIPLGIYESPLPYHKILSADELKNLVSSHRLYFMKDTSCDIEIIKQKLEITTESKCNFYNAHTPTILESLKLGAAGYCGIAANFYPELYAWLCKHYKTQPELSESLSEFLKICDSIIHNKYPVSAKKYQQINGINLKPLCRSSKFKLNNAESASLSSLKNTIKEWHEKLKIWSYE
ncbi:MAG TPA: dihydrodipicolinate synthase family protein [Victivallales bacterium]|nr:dihydrodipicolinate synthase family protein [Victivallales bacterium]